MFDAIKSLVSEFTAGDAPAGNLRDHELRVAFAALLMHAAAVDGSPSEAERRELRSLLQQRFTLDDAAASELVEEGAAADQKAVDLYRFTRVLNERLDDSERLRMIEMMWSVAYADGKISAYEDNLLWRVADLLGVSSTERIALRQRVAEARGRGGA